MNEGQTVTAIQPITTSQIFQNQTTVQPIPNKNTNDNKMDDLIDMMSQMQIKMMDLDKTQNNYNRNQHNRYNSNRRNYNDNRRNNNNDRNRNDNRNLSCWTCGKDGHKSPDCPD